MTDAICPCRVLDTDERDYADCCKPYLEEGKAPPTAEALMRSRYTAFVKATSIISKTRLRRARATISTRRPSPTGRNSPSGSAWSFCRRKRGGKADDSGYVEFIAHFSHEGERYAHRERSLFRKADARWFFQEEANRKGQPIVKGAQPGRNDPCPCGSGKKYKKCCGAAA